MMPINSKIVQLWGRLGTRFLPFADAATASLPLSRILRLSLFQISVGMALVLLNGTLNRVMIIELNAPAWLVAIMVSLPVLFAPFRAVLGFRSDNHRSVLGWRRVPYIWLGTMLEFGGLAIMPFALILLSGDSNAPAFVGYAAAALSFLLVGAGLHTTQTAGLALASDLALPEKRHRIVALLYVILLIGMVLSSFAFGILLATFSQLRLIQVIQGAAAVTMVLNIVALWKQEARNSAPTGTEEENSPSFTVQWRKMTEGGRARRLLISVALGTAAFSMQDILLEPFGGEILHQTVGETTFLTALMSLGALCGFACASRGLDMRFDPVRLAAFGLLCGLPAFLSVIVSAPLHSIACFRFGAFLIGFGGGLFTICTLTVAMHDASSHAGSSNGLALGAWGAVQATSGGIAILLSGFVRDAVAALAASGTLGSALTGPAVGYAFVYQIEIVLIFASLIAIGPLVRSAHSTAPTPAFGLAELPG